VSEALVSIAGALPADAESLGAFATRLFGDARALESTTPLGSLAAELASSLGGSLSGAEPGTAQWRRESWQSVGIAVDELSSTVLALGLPGGDDSPTARAIAALAAAGEPVVLTLRQLVADSIGHAPTVVFVCESPAVVSAAANRHGAASAALVCVGGHAGAAAVALLQSLERGGTTIRYHGDFDWSGIANARRLARHVAWEPWRFESADYVSACTSLDGLTALRGPAAETPWDPALSPSMATAEKRVEEDLLLETLLADLA
jgi:uncharacterized protein (TIGR02679 family)